MAKLNYPNQCHLFLKKSSYMLICCSRNVIPPLKTLPTTYVLVCCCSKSQNTAITNTEKNYFFIDFIFSYSVVSESDHS